MSSPKARLLDAVTPLVSGVHLVPGNTFLWSPKDQTVQYVAEKLEEEAGQWSLLHEIAHALLEHHAYSNDFELLQLELAAWNKAKELSNSLGVEIDPNYVEDCLDTYRDWLHQRSTCPTCGSGGLQHTAKEYRCHNCMSTWHVSASRFCRPYRMKQTSAQNKKSPDRSQTTFQ